MPAHVSFRRHLEVITRRGQNRRGTLKQMSHYDVTYKNGMTNNIEEVDLRTMKKTIVSCVLVGSLLFCIECSSSYMVSSSLGAEESFSTFNADAEGRSGTIVFQDGRKLDAQNIIASPDSTLFLNGETGAITLVPTQTIRKVVLTSHGVGFLEGFGWGALVGSAIVLAIYTGDSGHTIELDPAGVIGFVLLFGGGAGGVIGGIPGLIMGHSNEYQFVSSAESTKIK